MYKRNFIGIQYNGRDNIPTKYSMLPNKTLSTKSGLYLFEFKAKGVL